MCGSPSYETLGITSGIASLRQLFDLLDEHVECGVWWPAESRFEIAVGAVLTQNTAWRNVERAIANLCDANLLDAEALLVADDDVVRTLIRPAGYFNTKTRYLKDLTTWWIEHDQAAQELSTKQLREELLSIRGVGCETADDLLLYAYQRPVFIYDVYARRLLKSAGFGDYRTYGAAKRAIDPQVAASRMSVEELAKFHGLIVDAGKIVTQRSLANTTARMKNETPILTRNLNEPGVASK